MTSPRSNRVAITRPPPPQASAVEQCVGVPSAADRRRVRMRVGETVDDRLPVGHDNNVGVTNSLSATHTSDNRVILARRCAPPGDNAISVEKMPREENESRRRAAVN